MTAMPAPAILMKSNRRVFDKVAITLLGLSVVLIVVGAVHIAQALVPMAQEAELKLYQVHGVTQGTDAQAEVTVRLELGGRVVSGNGADVDTLVSSAKAYINALNRLEKFTQKLLLTDQDEISEEKKKAANN